MPIALESYRITNKIMSWFVPSLTAKIAMVKFLNPRRLKPKEWEIEAEAKGNRFQLDTQVSAIKWAADTDKRLDKNILLVHGWESRATQMYGFVPLLLSLGYDVIAIDMPAHGKSAGKESNAFKFLNTILLAENTLGSFDAIIGHSMGAGATSAAVSHGLKSKKLVLISGPSSIVYVLKRFSNFIGLNARSTHYFIEFIGEKVGVTPAVIDSMIMGAKNSIPTLFIHDKSDQDIPISQSERLLSIFTNAELFVTEGLGHRKILKSELVLAKVNHFLCSG